MSKQAIAQVKPQNLQAKLTPVSHGILQRCSNGVECEECRKKRESSTMTGKRLLAYELTHVVQQGTRPVASLATFSVSSHSDASEREANGVADAILMNHQASPLVIQRTISTSNTHFIQRQSNPGSSDVQPEPSPAVKTSSAQSLTIDSFATNHEELTKEQKQHLILVQSRSATSGISTPRGMQERNDKRAFNICATAENIVTPNRRERRTPLRRAKRSNLRKDRS